MRQIKLIGARQGLSPKAKSKSLAGLLAVVAGLALGGWLSANKPPAVQAQFQAPDELSQSALEVLLKRIKLPPGFHISLFASHLKHPRQMCLSPTGTLFVGTMEGEGYVYALVDKNKDGTADETYILTRKLNHPNGVALKAGNLYIAEINRITRLDDIEHHLSQPPQLVVVDGTLPTKTHHGWKYIRFGPDGRLYVPQGSPCNVCQPDPPYFGTLSSMNADGTDRLMVARGIRNTVGFDWDPLTKKLWFTDNGRDLLGDDKPPDELNFVDKPGMHFGFPYRWGDNQPDPTFGNKAPANLVMTPPAQCLGPHVASLGMRFYEGKNFPKQYHHRIFIAEHGSWNRSKKIGYRVSMVTLEGNKAVKYEPFAYGWLNDDTQEVSGRPVDINIMEDGSMLVSDDYAGNIYRITYDGK